VVFKKQFSNYGTGRGEREWKVKAALPENAAGPQARHGCEPHLPHLLGGKTPPCSLRPRPLLALCRQIPCARLEQTFVESRRAK